MKMRVVRLLSVLFVFAPLANPVKAGELPASAIPDAFGVATHFMEPVPATRENDGHSEADRIRQVAGYIRLDLFWDSTEPVARKDRPGDERFDWLRYDRLLRDLNARGGARPLNIQFILVYNNPLYWSRDYKGRKRALNPANPTDAADPLAVDTNLQVPPDTPEERAGYANWAAKAVAHFGALRREKYPDMHLMWEIWNEPNVNPFWGRRPNAADYAALVAEAAPAMRRADPDSTILVGALSSVDIPFAEEICRRGVLRDADGFSVHPYGGTPEAQRPALNRLRRVLDRYSPDRYVPIVVSEFGAFTGSSPGAISALEQARYLVRARLLHLALGVRGTVYYDWKDDGRDPNRTDQNYGMTVQRFDPVFTFEKTGKGNTPGGLAPVQGLSWQTALSSHPGSGKTGKVADLRVAGFGKGESVVIRPAEGFEDALPADAVRAGMWVYGDGGNDSLKFQFEGARGNTIGAPAIWRVSFRGWKWLEFPLYVPPGSDDKPSSPAGWTLTVANGPGSTHDLHLQFDEIGAYGSVFDPKQAYTAARVLNETLDGFAVVRPLFDRSGETHLLLRERSARAGASPRSAVALWSTGRQVCDADGSCDPPNAYTVPDGASGTLVDMMGKKRRVKGGQTVTVGASPQYIVFDDRSSAVARGNLDLAASWDWNRPDGTGGDVPLAWSALPTDRPMAATLVLGNRTGHRLRYDAVSIDLPGGRASFDLKLPLTLEPGAPAVRIPVTATQTVRSGETVTARVRIRATDLDARRDAERNDTVDLPLVIDNPIAVATASVLGGAATVMLRTPDGRLPEGDLTVIVDSPELGTARRTMTVSGDTDPFTVSVPLPKAPASGSPGKSYTLGVRLEAGGREIARMENTRYDPARVFAETLAGEAPSGHWEYLGGYDNPQAGRTRPELAAGRKAAVTVVTDPERGKVGDVRLTFRPGRSYLSLIAKSPGTIPDKATAVGAWVNGDASGDYLAVSTIDRTGQAHQARLGPVNWTGWRWVVFPLDDPSVIHWVLSGRVDGDHPNDGTIRRPLRLETVFGIDGSRGAENGSSPGARPHETHIQFSDPTFLSPVPSEGAPD